MKVLSMAWVIYDERIQELSTDCIGGGAGLVVKNLCEYIGRKVESYLFVGKIKLPEIKLGNYTIVNSRIDIPGHIQGHNEEMLFVFKKALEEIQPDIVNVHGVGVLARKCILACKEKKVPCVYTDHLYVGRKREFKRYEETFEWDDAIIRIPDLDIVTVSTGMRTKILSDYPNLNSAKVTAIVNGTDFVSEIIPSNMKERYGIQKQSVLVCVGTILDRKNQLQVVRAFSLLPNELMKSIKIIFCGKDRLDGKLQKEIFDRGLENELVYAGVFSNEDMKKLYSVADGMIMPSFAEGLSIAELEAIAYGLPIIMYGDSECAEDLDDDKVVCLTEDRTDQALADAIIKWKEGKWNKAYIIRYSKKFTIEKMAENYIRYYNRLVYT